MPGAEFEPGTGASVRFDPIGEARERRARRWYVRLVRRFIGPGPYLDFGCGTGPLLRMLSEHGSASGFEVSEADAAAARTAAPGCPVHTTPDDIPCGVFRGITAIHVLEHLDDATARSVLACWRRVLVPGGRVLVVVEDPAGRAVALAGASRRQDPTRVNLKPHDRWRAFLADAGFTVLREGSDGLWNGPYGRLPRALDAVVHAVPASAQFLAGSLFLPPGSGESSVFVLENPAAP